MAIKKKVTSKKKAAKKTAVKKVAPAVRAIADKQTKQQIIFDIAEDTGLSKKEVAAVFAALGGKIFQHMKPRGSGDFSIPDTGIKVRRVVKPKTKARMGRNPFTGEEIKIPAKPARKVIRLSALKALKEML
jgi:nucleoid DNA-binding protein